MDMEIIVMLNVYICKTKLNILNIIEITILVIAASIFHQYDILYTPNSILSQTHGIYLLKWSFINILN